MNALAFTVGRDLVFGAGQYAPHTKAGSRLLAHELAHTLQDPNPGRLLPSIDKAGSGASGYAGAVLRRAPQTCTASAGEQPNQRKVHCQNGDYLVRMTSSKTAPDASTKGTVQPQTSVSPSTQSSVSAGLNGQNVDLLLKVCSGGTEISADAHGNLPQVVKNALPVIFAGKNPLPGLNFETGIKFSYAVSGSAEVSIDPTVGVDANGRVNEVGGGLSVTTPAGTFGGKATYDPQTHGKVITGTYEPGKTPKTVSCEREHKEFLVLKCQSITHVPVVPEVAEKKATDTQLRYLFFLHAKKDLNTKKPLPPDIKSLYDQGYRVTSIKGFTSPEGKKTKVQGFEGNIELSKKRADAALEWLQDKGCKTCDFTGVVPKGLSELPPGVGADPKDPEGSKMEKQALHEFQKGGTTPDGTPFPPDPLAPQDKELAREPAFELMRRAEITLSRQRVKEHEAEKPAHDVPASLDCPAEVLEVVRKEFGLF